MSKFSKITSILTLMTSFSLSSKAIGQDSCLGTVSIKDYVNPNLDCSKNGFFKNSKELNKRLLYTSIPCNEVTRLDSGVDSFGPGADTIESIKQSNHFKIYKNWLGNEERFFDDFDFQIRNRSQNPILLTAHSRAIHKLISEAKHYIFIDIFLFGGTWGVDIAQDLFDAAERGVTVVVLHDTESFFAVGNEVIPFWQEFSKKASELPNIVALDSNIAPPNRPSAIPFGLKSLTEYLSNDDTAINASGYSDHSKLLITDAIFGDSIDEYKGELVPKALIGSKNWVDSAAANYHDESVIVSGPAAVVAMMHYRDDIFWAVKQAEAKQTLQSADDKNILHNLLQKLNVMQSENIQVLGRGTTSVEPIQADGNDNVRNLDTGIIAKIVAAKESIDLYGKLAYNPSLAQALADAMKRGVKVRMVFDQQNPTSPLNPSLPFLISKKSGIKEENLDFYWHLPFRPAITFNSENRTNLFQEIHAKTIIIDKKLSLFGSTNLDTITWSGGFREYSVWIDDKKIAQEASATFDRLVKHPLLTVPHKVWLGKQEATKATTNYFENLSADFGDLVSCDSELKNCDYQSLIHGGKNFGPFRLGLRAIINFVESETTRIQQVRPENLARNNQGELQCKVLP